MGFKFSIKSKSIGWEKIRMMGHEHQAETKIVHQMNESDGERDTWKKNSRRLIFNMKYKWLIEWIDCIATVGIKKMDLFFSFSSQKTIEVIKLGKKNPIWLAH